MDNLKFVQISLIFVVLICIDAAFALNRCYACRSRGELGSCKDPFLFNATQAEQERGIELIPCASGWCGKMIEAENDVKEEYGVVHQRNCFQRGPSDSEDRCAYTKFKSRKVYMCFCKGDLCNSSSNVTVNKFVFIFSAIIASMSFKCYFLI
ncbi:protein quiver [Agrilus planipennis]|uniref:Protein quiver n=1 Tax=Agrilus planipennis TaxID=224129 RepID=A0A1W4XEN6_AGRPL|nr:protein quiver [Agrilus planipennis]